MTTIKQLVKENKVDIIEICRVQSGEVISVDSPELKKVEKIVVMGWETYQSNTTGKTHMRVVPAN